MDAREVKFTPEAANRFWAKVKKSDGCWTWTAALISKGYGLFGSARVGGGNMYAHRYSWELHNGKIPPGLFVLHRCDNPACVRPDHLFLGTNTDNMQDMAAKGRGNRARTHCKRGHPLSGDNIEITGGRYGRAWRQCLACRAFTHDAHRRRKRYGTDEERPRRNQRSA